MPGAEQSCQGDEKEGEQFKHPGRVADPTGSSFAPLHRCAQRPADLRLFEADDVGLVAEVDLQLEEAIQQVDGVGANTVLRA